MCFSCKRIEKKQYIQYFSRKSKTRSAAFPDPFIMITGSLFLSAYEMWTMVSMSPSQTITAIGTGISKIVVKYVSIGLS